MQRPLPPRIPQLMSSVMRACNGCRKRKIKCDAATTNTWPCSACTRLKLVCVPPTIGQDGDFAGQGEEADPTGSVGTSNVLDPSPQNFPMPQGYRGPGQHTVGNVPSYGDGMGTFPQFVHSPPDQQSFYGQQPYQSQMFPGSQSQPGGTSDPSLLVENDQSTADNLSEVLGELKIDESGIGMVPQVNPETMADLEDSAIYQTANERPSRARDSGAGGGRGILTPFKHRGGLKNPHPTRTPARRRRGNALLQNLF